MARAKLKVSTENSIIRGLIITSRDLWSRHKFEERIDYELAKLTRDYPFGSKVDRRGVKRIREEYVLPLIQNSDIILNELEAEEQAVLEEEKRKIEMIRILLQKGADINQNEMKSELDKFGNSLKGNIYAALRSQIRAGRRLKGEKPPLGYILKKVKTDPYIDAEVLRRSYKIGETTAEEHRIYYRTQDLIERLKQNPNDKLSETLRTFIQSLVNDFERNVEDFVNIEIDKSIQEARQLHRINHGITYLNSHTYSSNANKAKKIVPLIDELNALKKRANKWVYQDSLNARQLQRYAVKSISYGQKILESSEAVDDEHFPGIVVKKWSLYNQVTGIFIYDKNKPKPNRAIVLAHGAFQDKYNLETLGKRLATQGFWVYSLDLPTHGESKEKISLGKSSEYILTTVRWFRANKINQVAVVGQSLGALATLFALSGYTTEMEKIVYKKMEAIIKNLDQIVKMIKKNVSNKKAGIKKILTKMTLLREQYRSLKSEIFIRLKAMLTQHENINLAVMMASPKKIQIVLKPWQSILLKLTPGRIHRIAYKGANKLFNKWMRDQEGQNAKGYQKLATNNEPQFMSAVIADTYYTYNYAQKAKNPFDFINLLNFICDDPNNDDEETKFFRYYREHFVWNVPKLFLYGLADQKFKLLKKNNLPELEAHYRDMGATELVRFPDLMHAMNKEGSDFQFESGQYPKITYKIVTFINDYLSRGKMPIGPQAKFWSKERENRERRKLELQSKIKAWKKSESKDREPVAA